MSDEHFKRVTITGLMSQPHSLLQNVKLLRAASHKFLGSSSDEIFTNTYYLKESKRVIDDLNNGLACVVDICPSHIPELIANGFIIAGVVEDKTTYDKAVTKEMTVDLIDILGKL